MLGEMLASAPVGFPRNFSGPKNLGNTFDPFLFSLSVFSA